MSENKKHAKDAADALSSLYVFHAVVAALENGTITVPELYTDQSKIIKLAEKAQAKLLKIYDGHIAQISDHKE